MWWKKAIPVLAISSILFVGCAQQLAPGQKECLSTENGGSSAARQIVDANKPCPAGDTKIVDVAAALNRGTGQAAAPAAAQPTAVPVATLAAGSTPGTASATATPAAVATATASSAVTNTVGVGSKGSPPYMGGDSTQWTKLHRERLTMLDIVYKNQGLEAALKAAGITWDDKLIDARQPEEDTWAVNDTTNASMFSGIQVTVKNMTVRFPNAVTTNVASRVSPMPDAMSVTADERTGSKVWSNVIANGPVTVYVSVYSWGQFPKRFGMFKVDEILNPPGTIGLMTSTTPVAATPSAATTPTTSGTSASSCLKAEDIVKLGTVKQNLRDSGANEILAGWQVTFSQDWTVPDNMGVDQLQMNGTPVKSIKSRETGSLWMKPNCRPTVEVAVR